MNNFSHYLSSIIRKILIWLLIIVSIVVITGVGYIYGPSIPSWVRTLETASQAHFFSGGGDIRALYRMNIFVPEKESFSVPGKIVDYAKRGNVEVAIVVAPDGSEDLYLVSSTPEKITSDGGVKGYPSISADGTRIAFASLTVLQGQNVVNSILSSKLEDWTLVVLDLNTRQTHTLQHGYAPQFFTQGDKERLFFMINDGFRISNVNGTTEYSNTLKTSEQKILYPSIISPDGAHIALYDTKFNFIEIFKTDYTGTSSVALVSRGRLPQGAYAAAFSGDDVYSLMKLGEATAGMRVAPSEQPFQKTIIRIFGVQNFPYRLSI